MNHLSFPRYNKSIAIGLSILTILTLASSCREKAPAGVLSGQIVSYNEFGAAMLNIIEEDMDKAGFTLGDVILCPLKADPTVDAFNTPLIEALVEMSSRPGPYVVHYTEGKDRTGYVCALLEGLCGATYQEMVNDYLKTYENYYFVTPDKDPSVCRTLLDLRLDPCLMYYAGINDENLLREVDYAQAFSAFLLGHGMTRPQLDALIQALTKPAQ